MRIAESCNGVDEASESVEKELFAVEMGARASEGLADQLVDVSQDPAEITYYDHPAGGHVVSIGSITAGGSLVADAELAQIARNALGPPVVDVPVLWPGMLGALVGVLVGAGMAMGAWGATQRKGRAGSS